MNKDKDLLFIPFDNESTDKQWELPTSPKRDNSTLIDLVSKGLWIDRKTTIKIPLLMLHNEIIAFCAYLKQQMASDEGKRQEVYEWVKNVILSKFNNAEVQLFGSSATGLYLPNSDIDVVVFKSDDSMYSDRQDLRRIESIFTRQYGKIKSIELITGARVPIVKLIDGQYGISIDISVNGDDGYKAVEIINKITESIPHFRPLVIILKAFLKLRDYNDTYSGGIGSFLLQMMVLAYLQNAIKKKNYNVSEFTIAEALIGFLSFYTYEFKSEKYSICVNKEGELIDKSQVTNPGDFSLLSPFNFKDIGKSAYRYDMVQQSFKVALEAIADTKCTKFSALQRFLMKNYKS